MLNPLSKAASTYIILKIPFKISMDAKSSQLFLLKETRLPSFFHTIIHTPSLAGHLR